MSPSSPLEPTAPNQSPAPAGARSELTRAVLDEQRTADAIRLRHAVRRGCDWFYWIAALSLINSIIAISGGHVTFLAGLAFAEVADGFAAHMGFVGPYFAIGVDLIVAFFVCGFGYLASHGSRAALAVGMILYGLDALVFVRFGFYLPAAFHAYVLFRIWHGWTASRKLDRLNAEVLNPAPEEVPRRSWIS